MSDNTPRCGRCRFWARSPYAENNGMVDSGEVGNRDSSCRRHAPVALITPDPNGYADPRSIWPRTSCSDWCGDWEHWPVEKPLAT